MKKNISSQLIELIEKTTIACGVKLYDVEFHGKTLQIFITSNEKISVDTCAKVSHALSLALDMENLIPSRYLLEVSSPGLERKLRNAKDFEESIGQTAMIKTKINRFIGIIMNTTNDGVYIKNITGSNAKTGTEQLILFNDINFARILVSDKELFNEAKKTHKSNNLTNQPNQIDKLEI